MVGIIRQEIQEYRGELDAFTVKRVEMERKLKQVNNVSSPRRGKGAVKRCTRRHVDASFSSARVASGLHIVLHIRLSSRSWSNQKRPE